MNKLEKVILVSGTIAGLGSAFLGAGIEVSWLMYSGGALTGLTVVGVGAYEAYKTMKNENKIIKPKSNYQYKQAGKSAGNWNPRDWR